MKKNFFIKSTILTALTIGAFFHFTCLQGTNTAKKTTPLTLQANPLLQWQKNSKTWETLTPKKKILFIAKLLTEIEPKSQKEKPLSTIWKLQSKKTKRTCVEDAFTMFYLLQCGPLLDTAACTGYFAPLAAKINKNLATSSADELLTFLLKKLWDNIDNFNRQKWCSHSFIFLELFWHKLLPDEQMFAFRTTVSQKTFGSAKKILRMLSPEQSKEIVNNALMGDICYEYLSTNFTQQQKFLYCKELLKCTEDNLPLSSSFNACSFGYDIEELDKNDLTTIIELVRKSTLALKVKVEIFDRRCVCSEPQKNLFYSNIILELLKPESVTPEECLRVRKSLVYLKDELNQKINILIKKKQQEYSCFLTKMQ